MPSSTKYEKIDSLLALIQSEGALSQHLPQFEPREEQQNMLRDVFQACMQNEIALIEAGTGTGKSLAYLLPAIATVIEKGGRTLVATRTIHLQEQLIHKDIPLIEKILGRKLEVALVKGMGNYVCLRKIADLSVEKQLLSESERKELDVIEGWSEQTIDGSKSDLPSAPSISMWERVQAESDSCTRRKCPFFKKCHFMNARKQAEDANLLIANHNLLFLDLALKEERGDFDEAAVLPSYDHVVLDEAHHIEEVATECFAFRMSKGAVMRILSRMVSSRNSQTVGQIALLRKKILHFYGKSSDTRACQSIQELTFDIPYLHKELTIAFEGLFSSLPIFMDEVASSSEGKLRILKQHYETVSWEEGVYPALKQVSTKSQELRAAIHGLEQKLKGLKDEEFKEQSAGLRKEVLSLSDRLFTVGEALLSFSDPQTLGKRVRWVEKKSRKHFESIDLVDAELAVSHHLNRSLFQHFKSVVLCSATLTSSQSFQFIKQRLGVPEDREVCESLYNSPFDFSRQALFVIPQDVLPPGHPQFIQSASKSILDAIKASRGGAFILFTSYFMMKQCLEIIGENLKALRYPLLVQGEDQRSKLIHRFKGDSRSVLLGTDSFWEGVDVVGHALRLVVIAKLPFQVPTEPLIQARSEAISSNGGDPFFDYSLPQAILKLKQGVGRLIRNKQDRGCVVCLDSRLIKKPYGKKILKSLPSFSQNVIDSSQIGSVLSQFYRYK